MKAEEEIRKKRDEIFKFLKAGKQSVLFSTKELESQVFVLNWVLNESKQYTPQKPNKT